MGVPDSEGMDILNGHNGRKGDAELIISFERFRASCISLMATRSANIPARSPQWRQNVSGTQ
jgi:hypothetical protein